MSTLRKQFVAPLQKSPSRGGWTHKLPIKAELRTRIAKDVGDVVTVRLYERIDHP